jgi:hypothetical protein
MTRQMRAGHGRRHRWPHLPRPGRGPGPARARLARALAGRRGSPGPAWKASWCRATASLLERSTSPACAARARSRWRCCRCACCARSGRAPQVVRGAARRGGGPGWLHHLSGGMMAVLLGKPLVLHEQNSVAGMANRVLAGVADRVFTAFPTCCQGREWVGNPLRDNFLASRRPRHALCRPQRPAARAGGGWQPGRAKACSTTPCRRRWPCCPPASARR